MKRNRLLTPASHVLLATGLLWLAGGAMAQSSMRTVSNGNHEVCPPGKICDPCDTASLGTGYGSTPGPTGLIGRTAAPGRRENPTAGSRSLALVNGGPRLKIGYAATWWKLPGKPVTVGYCVVPYLRNIGNVPWSAPVTLKLVDGRYDDDNEREDPLFSEPMAQDPPARRLTKAHQAQVFSTVTLPGPIASGQTVQASPSDWCKTIHWFRGPALVITGAGLSCPVDGWRKGTAPQPKGSAQ